MHDRVDTPPVIITVMKTKLYLLHVVLQNLWVFSGLQCGYNHAYVFPFSLKSNTTILIKYMLHHRSINFTTSRAFVVHAPIVWVFLLDLESYKSTYSGLVFDPVIARRTSYAYL